MLPADFRKEICQKPAPVFVRPVDPDGRLRYQAPTRKGHRICQATAPPNR